MKNPTTSPASRPKKSKDSNGPKPAKKPRRRREMRPGEIISAARAVFIEKGFSAARIDDVAERAGASKGTIYLYFESKEKLFEAMAMETIRPVLDQLERLGALQDLPADRPIEAFIEFVYSELVNTARREVLHMIIAEGVRFPAIAEFYHQNLISKARDVLSAVMKRGVEQGVFRPDVPADHPEILMSPALIAALWKLLFDRFEPMDVEELKQRHLQMVRHTLLADPPANPG